MKLHYAIVYLYPSYLYSYTLPLLYRQTNMDPPNIAGMLHLRLPYPSTGDGLNPLERLAEDCPKTSRTWVSTQSTQGVEGEDVPRCTGREPPLPRAWGAGHACRLFAGRPGARPELASRFSTEVALSGVVVRVLKGRSVAIAFALKG